MKSLCVGTIQLNSLTDVPYKMTVGGAFVYVCERDRVKDFVYITLSVITWVFSRGLRRPRYNGVAVIKLIHSFNFQLLYISIVLLVRFVVY